MSERDKQIEKERKGVVELLFAFGQFWRRLSHLDKFNTCQWLSACAKFGGLGNLYKHTHTHTHTHTHIRYRRG